MTSTLAERDFLWLMFRYSAYDTSMLGDRQTILATTTHPVALHRDPKAVYRKVYNKEGKHTATYLIGMQDATTITTNKEMLIEDRLEDKREWIHTKGIPDKDGWRRLLVWPSDRLKDVLKPFNRQLCDLCYGDMDIRSCRARRITMEENKKMFHQLLKGLISEL